MQSYKIVQFAEKQIGSRLNRRNADLSN